MRSILASLLLIGLLGYAQAQEPNSAGSQELDEKEREAELFGQGDGEDETPSSDEEAAREESLFGGDTTGPESAKSAPANRDEAVLGETSSVDEMALRLAESDDTLEVGGLAFLRYNANLLDKGGIKNASVSSPNFMDVFLDSRPSDDLRFFARARLRHDPTRESEENRVQLDQLWMRFNLRHVAFFTVGRQRIKWGTGRFWNPTDYLNSEALDALSVNIFDERLGVSLAKVHVPFESIGANLYAIATVDDADLGREIGGALRAEIVVGTGEITASIVARRKTPLRMGFDYSGALGPIDIKLEGAVQRGVKSPYLRGELDTSPIGLEDFDLEGVAPEGIADAVESQLPSVLAAKQPTRFSREDEFIPQAVVGVEYGRNYSDEDAVYLGAEYFFNDLGYGNADFYPALFEAGLFRPFYVGRHYAAAYAAFPNPGSWNNTSITTSTIANLSDRSAIARLDYSRQFLTYLNINAFVMGHFGGPGEFNYSYRQDALLDPALLALVPENRRDEIPVELSQEFEIVGPRLSAGLGLRMQF